MAVPSPAYNDREATPHHPRNASHCPPATLSLYHSNFAPMPLPHCSLISPSSYLHKSAPLAPGMPYDYRSQAATLQDTYPEAQAGPADAISRHWTHTAGSSSPFCNPHSPAVLSARSAPGCGSGAAVSAPAAGFAYSPPASSFSFPSPAFYSGDLPSVHQPHPACEPLAPCPPATPSLERHLLPSASSHHSPIPWTTHNLSINALSSAHLSSSNSSTFTHSDPAPSNSSSRSWTPDQNDHSNPPIAHSELTTNTCHPFAPLGSPANFEQLPTPFFNHPSPPESRAGRPDGALRRLVTQQRPLISTSDASSDGHTSLLSQRSQFYEDPETLVPSPIFSPHPSNSRAHLHECPTEKCSPITPHSLGTPSLRLMTTSASFGIPPAWLETEIYSPLHGDSQSTYEGNCSPGLFLTTRNAPPPHEDHLPQVVPQCQSALASPHHVRQPSSHASFMPGKRHESIKSFSGSSSRVSSEPIPKPKEARSATCTKKKKREVREVEAFCIACGERMARLTLRGSPEELYVADGFDVVHTCKACHEGRAAGPPTLRSDPGAAPFPERTFVKAEHAQEGALHPDSAPQGAVTTFRKRNRRTDDVTAPTTCDCCARQLGVGGIVPRNGRSAIQFVVEVVCAHCVCNFRRCTDCGGGGGSRLGVGKWRCKELFSDGRRTCILSHQRQGASTDVTMTVWRVRHLAEKPELDTLVGQLRELVKHSLYAALATPEILESGLVRVTTFEEIKTMYANGWKQIQPLIHEDVESSTGRRRYVGLRWTKPHPRKGPKRGAPSSCGQTKHREGVLVLEPGKELSGFVLSEWDMHNGTFFVSVAMPWQSGDALESTASLSHKCFVEAKADRERMVAELVRRGTSPHEANLRYPPIRHLWTILFFHRETRLVQFLEKRRKFMPLEEYLAAYPDAKREMFPPGRDCYVPRDEQPGWNVWVRRENGYPPKTSQ